MKTEVDVTVKHVSRGAIPAQYARVQVTGATSL